MGNTLKIRRGSGAPTHTDFAEYELAYDYSADKLYIRDGNAMVEVGGGNSTATSSFLTGDSLVSYDGYIMTRGIVNENETGGTPAAITFGNGATYNNDNISLITAGQTALFINASGNVAIGGTTANRDLQVNGDGVIRLNNASGDTGIDFNSSDMQIRYRGASDLLQIYSYGTSSNIVTIKKSDGNVGIGTTSPQSKLHTVQTLDTVSNTLANGNYGLVVAGDVAGVATDTVGIHLAAKSVSGTPTRGASILAEVQSTGNNHDLIFATSAVSAAPAERMRITDTGNVGIGTNSPTQKLHIAEGNVLITKTNGPGTIYLRDSRASYNAQISQRSDGRISLATRAGTYGSNGSIEILDSGNVGIGTASPAEKLEISGGKLLVSGGQIRSGSYLEGFPSFSFANDTDTGMFSDTANQLEFSTGGSSRLTINSSGNVAINQGNRFYLDGVAGSGDTYIQSDSPDNLRFVVGNRNMIEMIEDDSQDMVVIGNGTTDVDFVVEDDAGVAVLTVDSSTSKTTLHSLDVTNALTAGSFELTTLQVANIQYTDGDAAITIANGGGVSLANGLTVDSGAVGFNGGLDMNENNISNVAHLGVDKIFGDADLDTQINFDGSDVITFDTGNTEAMRINASQNVGIGTNSPGALLHLNEDDNAVAFKVTGGRGGNKIASFVRDVGVASPYAEVYIHAGSGDPQITFRDAGNKYFSIGIDDSANSFKISDNSGVGTNDRLTISSSGDATFTGVVKLQSELDFTGNGNKNIDVETLENNNYLQIRHHNPVGNAFENAIRFNANGGALIYYNNGLRFETTDAGVNVTGKVEATGKLKSTMNGGFTIGNVTGEDRIQNSSNSFSFLTDGNAYANMTFGTVTAGTWQGSAIANAYIHDLPASKITSGTFSSARMPASFGADSVTQDDITNRTESGFYQTSTATTAEGWPFSGTWSHLLATTHTNDANYFSMQIAGSFFDQNFYGRKTNNSGTTSWQRFITTADVGSGNGLDADLLDGVNASGFPRRGNLAENTASSITTFNSNAAIDTSSGNQSGLQVYQDTIGEDAFMTFHVANDYALYFGLDGGTNDLAVGGWSKGANSYKVWHEGNTSSFTGDIVSSQRDKGLFGTYDSYKTDHIWSMGTAYRNSSTGADFGNLYGLAYKHVNNTTGGTMGGGHQMVWATNGTPRAALGETSIWSKNYFHAARNYGGSWDTGRDTALTFDATSSGTAYNVLRVNTDNGFKLQTLGGTGGTQRWYTSGSNYIQFTGTTITASLSGTATSANNLRDSSNNLVRIDGSNELNFYNSAGNAAALYINHHGSNSEVNIANSGAQIGQTYGVRVPDGSAATPTHSFNNDPDLGFYRNGSNNMRFSAGNAIRGTWNGDGLVLNGGSLGVNVAIPTTDGVIRAGNDVIAYYSSDKRLKENVKPIENAINKVSKIRGVEFDWIVDKEIHDNEGHDVGVIAQEVEKVLPEVVETRNNGYKAVKYEKIVSLLIEAIKEQQQQINKLEEKLNG